MKRCQMIDFLVRAAIPNVTEKDRLPRKEGIIENSNLLWDAIFRAHRDVLTGRRYVKAYSEKHEILSHTKNGEAVYGPNLLAQALYFAIKEEKEQLCSTSLVEKLTDSANEDSDSLFGCIQKLVNMTLKYLFVLQEFGYLEKFHYDIPHIDEISCDCPIDSIILKSLDRADIKWTSLSSDDYEEVQGLIDKDEQTKTRLEYDFKNWSSFQECPWSTASEC